MRHIAFCLFATLALAACKPEAAPSALLVGGQTVEPICFAPYLMREDAMETISLDPASCAPGLSADNTDFSPIEGYTGTGFYFGNDPETRGGMRPAFIAYKYLGEVDGRLAIELIGSGGGTGVFSTVFTAARTGDTLTAIDIYAGGDRCNGGVTEASVKDGVLYYAYHITPYDFLTLNDDNPPSGIEPYDDIAACAACCFGEALYKGRSFIGVRIPEDYIASGAAEGQDVQACFDEHIAGAAQTEWDAAAFDALRDQIRKDCTQ